MSHIYSALCILVVEDEPSFMHMITILLEEMGVKQIIKKNTYQSGLEAYKTYRPNICILDINLDNTEKDGIALATQIREFSDDVSIIFLTSFFQESYYLKAREVAPSSFMSKDISRLKLMQALDIATASLHRTNSSPPTQKIPEDTHHPVPLPPVHLKNNSTFFFKVGDVFKAFNIDEIIYFYADNKLTYARIGNRNYPTSVQLKILEDELAGKFCRCHKKYLINIDAIDSVLIKEDKVKMGEELLPIGYAYRKSFIDTIHPFK